MDYATPSDFWFETDGDLADSKVAEFNFPLKGQSVAIDDLFDGLYDSWVTLNKEIPDDGIILLFTSADSSAEIEIYYNWYESDQQYIFGGTSTRTPDESEEMKAELVLTDVYLERFGGYEHIPMDGMEDYTVTVQWVASNSNRIFTNLRPVKTFHAGIKVIHINMQHCSHFMPLFLINICSLYYSIFIALIQANKQKNLTSINQLCYN